MECQKPHFLIKGDLFLGACHIEFNTLNFVEYIDTAKLQFMSMYLEGCLMGFLCIEALSGDSKCVR